MASKDRFSKLKVYKYTRGGMALCFVLLFAGVGTYLLTQSKAANVNYANFFNSNSVSPTAGVYPAGDSIYAGGSQNVTQVTSGSKLKYSNANKVKYRSICYYFRISNSLGADNTAKVEFVGQGNTRIVNLDASDDYQSVCVKSGHKNQKPYNVYNMSSNGPDVLVYQAITSS